MPRVLAFSSHVAFGSVGLAVIVPALHGLGHEVMALPTILLSNHPGYGRFAGEQIAPINLQQIIDALDANGWLARTDAVLTGYLPTATHVATAAKAIERVRSANPSALVICDPVCGDEPDGLYLPAEVPAAIAEMLLPQSDIASPNAFELAWFSGASADTVYAATGAARTLNLPAVLATSIPAGEGRLATLLVGESAARACFVPRRATAPHGTGDLMAALYLGHVLNGVEPTAALGRAVAAVEVSISMSNGQDELSLTYAGAFWAQAEPLPTAAV